MGLIFRVRQIDISERRKRVLSYYIISVGVILLINITLGISRYISIIRFFILTEMLISIIYLILYINWIIKDIKKEKKITDIDENAH